MSPNSQPVEGEENRLLAGIVRLRWLIFVLVGLLMVASFNGRWRVGRDSALYREVARNLLQKHTYTYRGEKEKTVYPGLPMMLASVERIIPGGDPLRPVAPLVVMMLMAGATLMVVYRLVRLHFPPWLAVCVTTGVAINIQFLEQANELMADTPFLLGVCLALLGFEELRLADRNRRRVWGLVVMFGGLMLAGTMRPTFWALALAWILACLWGVIRGPKRLPYALALAVLVGLGTLWLATDPRTHAFNPLGGRYESAIQQKLGSLAQTNWWQGMAKVTEEHFPIAFVGVELGPVVSSLFTLVVLAAGVALIRRFPLWGLLVIISTGMTLLFGSVPRYFLMILPLLLVAWGHLLYQLSRRVAWKPNAPELLMFLGLGLAVVPNIIRDVDFIAEQHGVSLRHPSVKPFLQVYRDGKMSSIVQVSDMIRDKVPAGVPVFGPEPRIMTFLSGHNVYMAGEITPRGKQHVSRLVGMRFGWAVFPANEYDKDAVTRQFIRRGIIQPDPNGSDFTDGRLTLAEIMPLSVTTGHHTRSVAPPPSTKPSHRRHHLRSRPTTTVPATPAPAGE